MEKMKVKYLRFSFFIFFITTSCTLTNSETAGLPNTVDSTQENTSTLVFTLTASETQDRTLSDRFLGQPMIVMIEYWYDSIIVQDVKTGAYREIYNDNPVGFWDWANNGCELIIGPVGDFQGSILRIDLQGNILDEITTFKWDDPWGLVENVSFSPHMNFVAYVLSDYSDPGNREPILYNLYISPIDQPQDYIKLSKNDGVGEAVWSPTDSIIAYSDFDNNGVHQLYVSNTTGTDIVQLTSFTMPGNEIHAIVWSPDGNKIAFYNQVNEPRIESNSINIIAVTTENTLDNVFSIEDILDKGIFSVENIWWVDEDTIVADIALNELGSLNRGMYWIEINRGEVINHILQDETPIKFWNNAILIDDDRIGYFAGDSFCVYNNSGKVEFKIEELSMVFQPGFLPQVVLKGKNFVIPNL